MDLSYVTDNNFLAREILSNQGYDIESLSCMCGDLISLSNEINLELGDLKDFVFRLKNRHDQLCGKAAEIRIKSEDQSPLRISYQPHGQKMYFFTRGPNQENTPYKECCFYCEACGPKTMFYKKEIKIHVSNSHSR